MRFRCWNGTFLGPKDEDGSYLSSQEAAIEVTRQTLALFAEHGVEPVIESSVRTTREMEEALAMLLHDSVAMAEPEGEGIDVAEGNGERKRPYATSTV